MDKNNYNLIIEASAGTGKTYTIINKIVEILKNGETDLSKILVLTFTEAATNELKERVRGRLKDIIDNSEEDDRTTINRFKDAYENFDNNSIFTIHSFCKLVIDKYPIETKSDFQYDVIDDSKLYKKCLYRVLNSEIYKRYSEKLIKKLLIYSDFSSKSDFLTGENIWESTIYQLIKIYDKRNGDIILPKSGAKESWEYIELVEKMEREVTNDYQYLKENLNGTKTVVNLSIELGKRDIGEIIKLLDKINEILSADIESSSEIENIRTNKDKFEDWLEAATYPKYKNLAKIDDEIRECTERLERIFVNIAHLETLIFPIVVDELIIEMERYKREKHLVSFNDLLTIVDDSVDSSEILLNELRSNYSYLIVDEFQDTDSTQWSILKRIFVDSKEHNIIVIGDPKQAIYGFRKANVRVYESAVAILKERGSTTDSLKTNHRSSKEFIDAANIVLNSKSYFNREEFVDSPADNSLSIKIESSEDSYSEVAPVTFVDLNHRDAKINATNSKNRYANFISKSVSEITSPNSKYRVTTDKKEEQSRKIEYDDICVLVRSRSDAIPIENLFKRSGIPYSFYNKDGLYETKEAYNIYYLLKAIAYPEDNGNFLALLLTRFIGFDIEKLSKVDVTSEESKIYRLFQEWLYLAGTYKFSELFHSIIVNSYLIFNETIDKEGSSINNDYDRKITNYEHIFGNLLKEATKKRLNIIGIVELLERYIRESDFTKEIDLQRLESDKKKVKIMTMHSSKGLEFPIVYVAGGFSRGSKDKFYNFYDKKDDTKNVFDLTKREQHKRLHREREEDEEKRLFYVVLTRAKLKIFIPFFTPEKNTKPLLMLIREHIDIDGLSRAHSSRFEKSLYNHYDERDSSNCSSSTTDGTGGETFESISREKLINIESRVFSTSSFTSLSKSLTDGEPLKERDFKKIDENNDRILPYGTNLGNMFHKAFEKIDFNKFGEIGSIDELNSSKEESILRIREQIERAIDHNILSNMTREKIEKLSKGEESGLIIEKMALSINEIIFNTLNVPIEFREREDFGESRLLLSSINKNLKINELKFTYSKEGVIDEILDSVDIAKIGDINKKGYMTGSIDMIFSYENKFYILDWKSNACETYSGDEFYKLVEKDYSMQYQIYFVALIKWLKSYFGEEFSFESHFGGIIYLYLRGRASKQLEKYGNRSGVYFNNGRAIFEKDLLK